MKEQDKKMELPKITLDELFPKNEDKITNDKVISIPLKNIDDFPNHPYKVVDNDDMKDMSESIKEHGVTQPVIVRKKDNGRYEMISGHRRKRASELAGKEDIIAIVKDLTDEEAIILMVDSNENQREEILPSERAFAYKMKMNALNKQGKRTDLTLSPLDTKLDNAKEIGQDFSDSRATVFRYIRLTELIPEILDMVDEKKIAFRPAVEMSYLNKENQYVLLDIMQFSEISPSLAQAIHLKKLQQENKLNTEKIEEIMSQEKPNQKEKIKIDYERFEKVFPKNVVTNKEREDFLFMCVQEHNQREKNKMRDRGR